MEGRWCEEGRGCDLSERRECVGVGNQAREKEAKPGTTRKRYHFGKSRAKPKGDDKGMGGWSKGDGRGKLEVEVAVES